MTRGQRRLHALLWPLLAILIAGVIVNALLARQHVAFTLEHAEPR